MLSETIIRKMKQTNISVNPEETKQRVKNLWKSATSDEKAAVEALAGVSRSTVARIYKTGSISAKLTIPIAQTLNTDPYYLTGESDERGAYTDSTLQSFMQEHNYGELLTEQKQLDKKTSRAAKTTPKPPQEEPECKAEVTDSDAMQSDSVPQEFLDNMSEDDLILLLRSVLLRAKAGGKNAEIAKNIKLLLLS